MTSKFQFRLKMVLYFLVLVLALLLQTSVFGTISLGVVPCVMPVAVTCISICEGAQRGCIFGLIGGCLWAWSTQLSFYGAWCIMILTVVGTAAGLITDRYLLQGVKTALSLSAGALVVTDGFYTLSYIFSGILPFYTFFTVFVPGALMALILCLGFYPLTARISRIGGFHG